MKKIVRYVIVLLVIALFAGTLVYLQRRSRPEPENYAEIVAVRGSVQRSTVVTGKIIPRDEVNIKPRINGIISEILKEPGQMVRSGEVIAKLTVIPDMGSLSSAQSRVRLAQINLRQAQTDFDREKALYDKALVSAEQFEKAQQALHQAMEESAAAQETLEVVRDGVSSSNATSSSTLVRSTISGLILDIPVKVGNSVIQANTMNDGTTVATVANMKDLIFDGDIDETEVGVLREGMPMVITIGALQNYSFEATLEYISPKAVEKNGSNQFEIKAAVRVDSGDFIRSGYSANAEIVLQRAEDVVLVPESCLEFDGGEIFVQLKQEDGTYQRTKIETGLSDGINIEVKSGVSEGDVLRGGRIINK